MVRVAVTSDLHYDPTGTLTPPDVVRGLVSAMAAAEPDAVVIAGDLAHGLPLFEACLDCFSSLNTPAGIIPGNHDVWRDPLADLSSLALLETALPAACRERGFTWLEEDSLLVRDVAIVGGMCWYDYSAVDPAVGISDDTLEAAKSLYNNDAHWVDWVYSDREMSSRLVAGLARRLAVMARDSAVRGILVATHVPVLEQQMVRKPENPRWGLSNAYFGNLTAGQVILGEPKVQAIISGHTHVARSGTASREAAGPVRYEVIGSEYGAPVFLVVEV